MTALQKTDQLPIQAADNVTMISVISRAASDPTVDIEKLERLMAMKERMDAKEAETAFNDAMSDAQARIRPISADLTNPQTRSKYASYAKLDGKLRPIYTDSGFSLSFDTDDSPKEDHVRVLVSALVLTSLAGVLMNIPEIGTYLTSIFNAAGTFAAGAALMIVARNIWRRYKP